MVSSRPPLAIATTPTMLRSSVHHGLESGLAAALSSNGASTNRLCPSISLSSPVQQPATLRTGEREEGRRYPRVLLDRAPSVRCADAAAQTHSSPRCSP